jgi:hypothetical protein
MPDRSSAWAVLSGKRRSAASTSSVDELEVVSGTQVEVMLHGQEASDSAVWHQASVLAMGGGEIVGSGLSELLSPWDGWMVGGTPINVSSGTLGGSGAGAGNRSPCELAVLELDAGDGARRRRRPLPYHCHHYHHCCLLLAACYLLLAAVADASNCATCPSPHLRLLPGVWLAL